MSVQTDPAVPPRVIAGRYALLGELGRGGMGVVWRAEDQVIGRQVAVKELRLADGVSAHERDTFAERVLREARTAGRLNDPALVTVFDVVNTEGATFIVMELVEAPTLSDLVRSGGPLPADRVTAIGEQVLAALEVAHAAGVVHRDVKPSNIMVLPNGRVKLTDFGIARAADDPKLTTSGALIGSPAYMAPERVQGKDAGPASDLWALGAVLYYAAEGCSPFDRDSTAATLHAVVTETPVPVRSPGRLASVIQGLLIADPATRLTAPQVTALLHAPMAEPDPLATLPDPAARYLPPHLAPMYAGPMPATPTPTKVEHRARIGLRVAVAVLALLVGAGLGVGGYFFGHAAAASPTDTAMQPTLTYGSPDADLASFDLEQGACGNGQIVAGNHFTSDDSVDCATHHTFVVFDSTDVLGNTIRTNYPGRQALAGFAESACALIFHSEWITDPNKDDDLYYRALIPSQGGWQPYPNASTGSRHIVCVMWRRDGGALAKDVVVPQN